MYDIEVTLVGNVCSDIRFLTTEQGVSVASFRVASTPRRYKGGSWVDGVTTYASITCWRSMAENVASSMGKGDAVIVHGRMTMRPWEKDGRTGQTMEVEAIGVGHDLKWGTSAFQRNAKKEVETVDSDSLAAELATSFDREEAGQATREVAA